MQNQWRELSVIQHRVAIQNLDTEDLSPRNKHTNLRMIVCHLVWGFGLICRSAELFRFLDIFYICSVRA